MGYLDTVRKVKEELAQRQEPTAIDRIIDDQMVAAVLIDSDILGAPIWFALDEDFKPGPGDTTPVFYASELPFLRTKSAETLQAIFKTKLAFGGGMVRQ